MKPIAQNAMSPPLETQNRFEQGLRKSTAAGEFFDQHLVASTATDSDGPIICRLCDPPAKSPVSKSDVSKSDVSDPDLRQNSAVTDTTSEEVQDQDKASSFKSSEDDPVAADEVSELGVEDVAASIHSADLVQAGEVPTVAELPERAPVVDGDGVGDAQSSTLPSEAQIVESAVVLVEPNPDEKTLSEEEVVSAKQAAVPSSVKKQNQPLDSEIEVQAEGEIPAQGAESVRSTNESVNQVELQGSTDPESSGEEITRSNSFSDSHEHQQSDSQGHEAPRETVVASDDAEAPSADATDLNRQGPQAKSVNAAAQFVESAEPAIAETTVTSESGNESQATATTDHEPTKVGDKLASAADQGTSLGEDSVDEPVVKPTESRHHIRLNSMQQQRMLQRVTKAFELAQQRGGEIRLRLSPPALGSLKVELKFEGQQMSAKLEAEQSQARQLILEHLPALRDRLAEQGISIETFEVDLYHEQPGDAQYADQESTRDDSQGGGYSDRPATESPTESVSSDTGQQQDDQSLNVVV